MGNALLITQLILQMAKQLQDYSALLVKAHSENRDVTDAELNALVAADDAAKKSLQDKIDAKRRQR